MTPFSSGDFASESKVADTAVSMADEPTLPRLPGPHHSARSFFANSRKRGRGALATPACFSTSSDPAIFSSDDDPALDNYIHGRRKKRYVGAWFDQHPASSDSADSALGDDTRPAPLPKPKRQLRRQLDSGVWMAHGDSTDADDCVELEPRPARLPLPAPSVRPPPPPRPRYSPEELAAQAVVQDCLDKGIEEVDLSHRELRSISDAILEPINQIAPIPNVLRDVAFEHRDPEIKLYLFANSLQKFPASILNIEYLTVLSLRGNALTELPPALASLKYLQTLNVSQNQLRYLPGELLDLLKEGSTLRELQIHPNPFFQLKVPSYCDFGAASYEEMTFPPGEPLQRPAEWMGVTSTLRARTPVQFSDLTSAIRSDFRFPQPTETPRSGDRGVDQEDFWELARPKMRNAREEDREEDRGQQAAQMLGARGGRSLFELALSAAARYHDPEEIKELLCEDQVPGHFVSTFDSALHIHQMGGQRCCVCERKTLCPATRWIEFRDVHRTSVRNGQATGAARFSLRVTNNTEEALVPFMRKGCSWSCIPYKTAAPIEPPERIQLMFD